MSTPLTLEQVKELGYATLLAACHSGGFGLIIPPEIRRNGTDSVAQHIIDFGAPELHQYIRRELVEGRRKRRQGEEFSSTEEVNRRRIQYEPFVMDTDPTQFAKLPSPEQVRQCFREFYQATSQAAITEYICSVCGRRRLESEEGSVVLPYRSIPNGHRLFQRDGCRIADVWDRMVLEMAGMEEGDEEVQCRVCRECLIALERPQDDESIPPKHALANNLWIGPIPDVLEDLTVCEQMLLALILPRVFVYKLYPAGRGEGPTGTFQQGLRGTVTSYELDKRGFSDMVEGRLLPRPLTILAKVISIVVVGRGKLNESRLLPIFRVRRNRLHGALVWLKKNNPKYFGDIAINLQLLDSIPNDDLPPEIVAMVRQSEEVEVVREEEGGYVTTSLVEDIHPVFEDHAKRKF